MAVSGRKSGDDALALALAQGKTVKQAAEQASVSERTVYRRLESEEFKAEVARLRAGMVERAMGALADGMADAAVRLRELIRSESEAVSLGACRSMIELGVKLKETCELEARVAAIEEARSREGVDREPEIPLVETRSSITRPPPPGAPELPPA
jgi:hypothetical protein